MNFHVGTCLFLQADPLSPQNRIARFTYDASSPALTLASELVLLTSGEKYNSIHSAGWLDFKPSDYVGSVVRKIESYVVVPEVPHAHTRNYNPPPF